MSTYRSIETDAEFSSWMQQIREQQITTVAVDIEAEFNLHMYGEHFCLLQIFDGHQSLIVDPQTVSVALMQEFFENRTLLKITYDSASDRALLFKNHGIRMRALLDLRPAVDLLEYEKQGLSSVLELALGKAPVEGKKRFQQYNWMRRPIDLGAIEYALGDVLSLFELKDRLLAQLTERNLMERYILENLKVQDVDPETDRKPGFLRSSRFRKLDAARQARLEALYGVRERYARDLNLPPNSVLPNRTLYDLIDGRTRLQDLRPGRGVARDVFDAMKREMGT